MNQRSELNDLTNTATGPATALRVADVTKRYGAAHAVDGVSFDLGDHELIALVGPSGCGKSTLLRMIAGLVSTESGSITIGRTIVDDGTRSLPPERRSVGLVFQEHALFPHLTVARNVAFGVRSGDVRARVADMLRIVGLDGYGERFPHELSGGERQRVALARALAPQPSLMLLDEPFASLDPNLRSRVRDDVVDVLRSTGTPAVFVTHDQAEALAIGDRVAVMRSGRIAQLGTPDEVFHRPVDRFVAAFMGEADFLTRSEAGDLADDRWASVGPDQIVMVRPDDITFVVSDAGATRVVGAEFRGSVWNFALELASGATIHSIRSHLEHVSIGATVDARIRLHHTPVILPADDARC